MADKNRYYQLKYPFVKNPVNSSFQKRYSDYECYERPIILPNHNRHFNESQTMHYNQFQPNYDAQSGPHLSQYHRENTGSLRFQNNNLNYFSVNDRNECQPFFSSHQNQPFQKRSDGHYNHYPCRSNRNMINPYSQNTSSYQRTMIKKKGIEVRPTLKFYQNQTYQQKDDNSSFEVVDRDRVLRENYSLNTFSLEKYPTMNTNDDSYFSDYAVEEEEESIYENIEMDKNLTKSKTRRGKRARKHPFVPYSLMGITDFKLLHLKEEKHANRILKKEIKREQLPLSNLRYFSNKKELKCPNAPRNTTQFLIHDYSIRDQKDRAEKEERRRIRKQKAFEIFGEEYSKGEITPYGFEVEEFENMTLTPETTERKRQIKPTIDVDSIKTPKIVFDPATPYGFEWTNSSQREENIDTNETETQNCDFKEIEKKSIENLGKSVLVNLVVQLNEQLKKEKQRTE